MGFSRAEGKTMERTGSSDPCEEKSSFCERFKVALSNGLGLGHELSRQVSETILGIFGKEVLFKKFMRDFVRSYANPWEWKLNICRWICEGELEPSSSIEDVIRFMDKKNLLSVEGYERAVAEKLIEHPKGAPKSGRKQPTGRRGRPTNKRVWDAIERGRQMGLNNRQLSVQFKIEPDTIRKHFERVRQKKT
jgi:hypothetical protein